MMKQIAFIFTQAPQGSSLGREGLDAVLASAVLCEPSQIGLFFIHDGVLQLLPDQQPQQILARAYSETFKLLTLYAIDRCYLCEAALLAHGLTRQQPFIVPVICLTPPQLRQRLATFDRLLTF